MNELTRSGLLDKESARRRLKDSCRIRENGGYFFVPLKEIKSRPLPRICISR